jgi:shikimate kinase
MTIDSQLPAETPGAAPALSAALPGDASQAPATTHVETVLGGLGDRLIVLVGMMASGKTSVGRLLGQRLGLPFMDADHEIETAAHMTVPEIFARHGEPYFRSGEKRVIARLLGTGPAVLATGGGAFMNAETREAVAARGISVWLKADADTIVRRARRRSNRPLLQTNDPEKTVRELMASRYPVYALADVTVESEDGPHENTVDAVLAALANHVRNAGA